jgi:hypothetical protein
VPFYFPPLRDFFPQRDAIPFFPIADSCALVSFFARAFPPIRAISLIVIGFFDFLGIATLLAP